MASVKFAKLSCRDILERANQPERSDHVHTVYPERPEVFQLERRHHGFFASHPFIDNAIHAFHTLRGVFGRFAKTAHRFSHLLKTFGNVRQLVQGNTCYAVVLHLSILLLAVTISGCGKKAPVVTPTTIREVVFQEVLKPIPVKSKLPPELLAAIDLPMLEFVAPNHPLARAALTEEGLRIVLAWLSMLPTIREALKAYDAAPLPEK